METETFDRKPIVVIQSSWKKFDDAARWDGQDGLVEFVASPKAARRVRGVVYRDGRPVDYVRPIDEADYVVSDVGEWGSVSYLDVVKAYADDYRGDGRDNPMGVLPIYEIYLRNVYRRLVRCLGVERVFVLSGCWGIVRADFLSPYYDVTHSTWMKGRPEGEVVYRDFFKSGWSVLNELEEFSGGFGDDALVVFLGAVDLYEQFAAMCPKGLDVEVWVQKRVSDAWWSGLDVDWRFVRWVTGDSRERKEKGWMYDAAGWLCEGFEQPKLL